MNPYDLTEQQMQIVSAVARGLRNKEIAQELGTSVDSVMQDMTAVYDKTGVSTRIELIWLMRGKQP